MTRLEQISTPNGFFDLRNLTDEQWLEMLLSWYHKFLNKLFAIIYAEFQNEPVTNATISKMQYRWRDLHVKIFSPKIPEGTFIVFNQGSDPRKIDVELDHRSIEEYLKLFRPEDVMNLFIDPREFVGKAKRPSASFMLPIIKHHVV